MITVTFEPDATLDPAQLQEAVKKVDFTPTGVRVWVRGLVTVEGEPAGPPGEANLWLEIQETGQRLLLAAADEQGREALEALRAAGSEPITVYGAAELDEAAGVVTVRVEGSGTGE